MRVIHHSVAKQTKQQQQQAEVAAAAEAAATSTLIFAAVEIKINICRNTPQLPQQSEMAIAGAGGKKERGRDEEVER